MIEIKIRSHPQFLQAFSRSTLPFDHYYVYGDRIVRKSRHQWQMDFLEELRQRLRTEDPSLLAGPEITDPADKTADEEENEAL